MLEALARAKINLTLDITGLLPDGYHELETVMQSIALCDRLVFSPRPQGIELQTDSPLLPSGPENLVYRAAELLQRVTGCRQGVHIFLSKNIPVAAGLGGGSADAAATLAALNQLWSLGLSREELLVLAAKLGADVPFCLVGGTVLARGKGELLTPLKPLPPLGVVLVTPPLAASTAQIYREYDRLLPGIHPDTPAMVAAIERQDVPAVAALLENTLEPVTTSLYPQVTAVKEALKAAGALGVVMSGSGPTVFGLSRDEEEARRVAGRLNPGLGRILYTRFCNHAIKLAVINGCR
ncbi:4-(cytidine 5'-diphospho)-2-C-methyl-D-erythritol kinase [Desulfofundulus salinus]|uniref:4-diphosphocytidyl-2-C-methyl-D-erythritol kinase n=1 Tax=Desulfofundulus salinus TaxID=2419843 RepID=A0A494WXN4_9FIRM|nr:4-(cytidine 5'-diphospho)-2-C-methyl-D-erythritol kinase [Desulfofundulus salinum]RKO67911.1 4-(cytidine 5'-diphospho)-2-C-methyl-D-erythritol kinase [Desulfofundulus salinum]